MFKARLKYLFTEDYWSIYVVDALKKDLISKGLESFPRIRIPNSKGCYYADPFILSVDPLEIVCEEFVLSRQYGRIVSLTFSEKLEVVEKKVLLEDRAAHYSYPFVWKENDTVYVVPESSAENNVKLYQYHPAQKELGYCSTLLSDFAGLDSTIHESGGIYYLFSSTRNNNLYSFSSEKLEGPYLPCAHPVVYENNPKVRSAGDFFRIDNTLFRPAQDCSDVYGGGILLYEIQDLGEGRLQEKERYTLYPRDAEIKGLHTLNGEGICVIDMKETRFSLLKPFYRLKRKINIAGK